MGINDLLDIKESYQAPERIMNILQSDECHGVFMSFLDEFNYDVSYDWFHEYFLDEHADRRVKKQDFTPDSINELLSAVMNPSDVLFEPAAGSGGMIIKAWQRQMTARSFLDYEPLDFFVVAEEMSDRTIPFLLFNLMVRGINGDVVHCNSLTRECKDVYFVYNVNNDYMHFSKLIIHPHVKKVEEMFNVRFMN